MLPDPKVGCHRTGFTKKCHKLVTGGVCKRWIMVEGTNHNSGQPVNEWGCIDDFSVLVGLQIAKDIRGGTTGIQKATESFRNEMVELNEASLRLTAAAQGDDAAVALLEDRRNRQIEQISGTAIAHEEKTS